MALHIGRKRQEKTADETTTAPAKRRLWPRSTPALWPRRTTPSDTTDAPATRTGDAPPTRTVVVERRPRRRWYGGRPNPVSMMVMAAGWAAALILVMGILLTWADANPGNTVVGAVLDTGRWLATPFHDAFTRSNPDHQLYLNWGIAAAVYYAMARVLSWLIRF